MNPAEFSQRLFQAEPGSPAAAALARDLVEDARYPARLALERYLSSADTGERMKAKNLLADLGELALVPLHETARWPDLAIELWVMRTMAEELVIFRRRATTILKHLLANRVPASAPEAASPLQYPPGTRVCDLAFILLHRLMHLESSSTVFLGTLPVDRDKQINQFQQSRTFLSAFESHS